MKHESWSAVITTHNSGDTLGAALDSLLALPVAESPVDIVVVDNASSDNSRQVAKARQGVRLVANRKNLGLAKANNIGAQEARGESLFFLNPDVVVLPGTVNALSGFAGSHPEAALLGPAMVDGKGAVQSSARTWPSILSVAARRTCFGRTGAGRKCAGKHLHGYSSGAPEKVHWLVGAALWLTPGGRSTVGLMNEAYFLYFEDVEWCRRVWRSGMEVWLVPEAVIIHECRRQSAETANRIALLHFRSMVRFYAGNPSALLGRGPRGR